MKVNMKMEIWRIVLAIYLVCINTAAFAAFGIDKQKAVKRKWRIRERTLIFLAALGGSSGALLGMYVFRHKTRHLKFVLGIPVIMIIQAAAVYVLMWI